MGQFNYSKLKYFDTKGIELPLVYNAPKIEFINPRYKDESGEYLVVLNNPTENDVNWSSNVSLFSTKTGKRFLETDSDIECIYTSKLQTRNTKTPLEYYSFLPYNSTNDIKEHYFKFLPSYTQDIIDKLGIDELDFPSLKFTTKLYFDKVSTGLVETESIYILTENPLEKTLRDTNKYTTVSDCGSSTEYFSDRYKLMFFIDCREQNNFRFFTITNDEVVWSDRKFIDFKSDNNYAVGDTNSGYRVDVGFVGEMEGVYEDTIYVFLIDTLSKDTYNNYPGDAHLIGEIKMFAETEGEDERYRTLCDNFGLPDPKETYDAFADTDILQESPDYVKINDYSKKLYLSYDQIFPYVGTYKALINALNLLGYNDIFFKEWYKYIGTKNNNNLVAFDISFKHNKNAKTISSIPLEERIQLKKLNWISMLYKMTEENDQPIDKFGFPSVEKKNNYYDNGTIVKLMSLRKYLEKYILGINCRITDVTGEGIIFERYNTSKYGTYQQVLEYNNEKAVSLRVDNPQGTIEDGVAHVNMTILTSNSNISLDDIRTQRFIDYCDGYINDNGEYHNINEISEPGTSDICVGKTLELNDNVSSYEIRALGESSSFRFNRDLFLTENSPCLIIDDGKIMFDPKDLLTYHRNSAFVSENLPVIQIKKGILKQNTNDTAYYKIEPFVVNGETVSYKIDYNGVSRNLQSVPTFLPPKLISSETLSVGTHGNISRTTLNVALSDTQLSYIVGTNADEISDDYTPYIPNQTYGLRYSTDNIYNIPSFIIKGYICSELLLKHDIELPIQKDATNKPIEWYIEILDGSMIFNDTDKDRRICVNFKHNENTNDVDVNVTTMQYAQLSGVYKYLCENNSVSEMRNAFEKGVDYKPFVNEYKSFNYEMAIHFDPNFEMPFYNTGTYKLNVLLYDQCNNVFSSPVNKKVTITTPHINTTLITDNNISNDLIYYGNINNTGINSDDDGGVCIYRYEPKRALNSELVKHHHKQFDGDVNDIFYHLDGCHDDDNDPGIKTKSNVSFGRFAQISNTFDRFTLKSVKENDNKKYLQLKKETSDIGHHVYNNDILDVNLIIYNSVSEYVNCIVNGQLSYHDLDFSFSNDISNDDIDNIITLCETPGCDLYIVPCWLMEVSLTNDETNKNRISNPNPQILRNYDNKNLLTLYYKRKNCQDKGATLILIDNINNNTITPLNNVVSYTPDSSLYNFYVSPADPSFVSYIMPLNTNKSTVDTICSDNSKTSKNISQHIDIGFTASVRDFDITIGQKWYNDALNKNINDCYIGTNHITTTGFVALSTDQYKTTYYETSEGIGDYDIMVEGETNSTENEIQDNRTYRWKIYKQSKSGTSRKLMIECFNKYPIFEIDETGKYDIEVTMYDENGNKHTNELLSAITVI